MDFTCFTIWLGGKGIADCAPRRVACIHANTWNEAVRRWCPYPNSLSKNVSGDYDMFDGRRIGQTLQEVLML